MDEILFRALSDRVAGYLDAVDRLARTARGPTAITLLRDEVRRLTAAWRTVLATHRRSTSGGCAGCRSRGRSGGLCMVWRTANAYFVAGIPLPHQISRPVPDHPGGR